MPGTTKLLWLLIAGVAITDAVWLPASRLTLVASSLWAPALASCVAALLAWFYRTVRRDARIASLTRSTAELIAFTTSAGILSYLMVTLNRPLLDEHLVAVDRATGLDWLAMHRWLDGHPVLNTVLGVFYISMTIQIVVLLLVLNFRGQTGRSHELVWLFALTGLTCVLFSGPWPTGGAFYHFEVKPTQAYVKVFTGLRDGTFDAIDLWQLQGVVQFPSFHTAVAILYAYASRGIPFLFPLMVAIDLTVIAATPAIGGHHFVDVWGGAAVAFGAIALVRRYRLAEHVDC
jgi:hypothetical protein